MIRTTGTWLCAAAFLAFASVAAAQTTTGTISGHVSDTQGLALPGVTVTAASPNLQGIRTVTTSENGDYVFTLLPPGTYTITFELSGFQRQQRSVTLAPTQTLPVDVTMGLSALTESVTVVGRAADVLTQTAQVATDFKQELIATLPTTRDINASLLLAPAVHPTGPSGAYSISGSMSFENLFMVNGVNVSENLRGQAYDLYIEDAIQETTIATAGISAEYGRFGGGVVNIITKSGGNLFSGSLRDTLNNDNWRALTPFASDFKVNKTVPTYEYTFGGPVLKDHLWFFTAGRLQTQETGRTLVITNAPYTFTDRTRRYEGKGTYSVNSNHTFQGAYSKITEEQVNNTFNTSASMDFASLDTRKLPEDLFTVNYNGILSPTFFVEGRVSSRHFSFIGDGAPSTDLVNGTLLIDQQRGTRYWSPTFCGICDPEKRDNDDVFVKGSYFLSKKGSGTHTMVFGYDLFNDQRFANNHQSGSDYRILGTTSIIQGTTIFPQFLGDGSTLIQWNPIPVGSQGTNFRTHSVFYNDNWRVTSRLTANLGVRYDRNHGADSAGRLVANDSAWSPRLGLVWDPTGEQKWSVNASFAKYVSAIANSIADGASPAGNPQNFRFTYRGPSINANPNAPLTATPDAIRAVFDWFFANGGSNLPLQSQPSIPGVTPQIRGSLDSPNALEYAGGVNRQFGSRAAIRVDAVYRNYRDFYAAVTNLSTGRVTDQFGKAYDLTLIENTNALKRRYAGLTPQVTYRFSPTFDVGGIYTLSRTWGNFDGENVGSGPITSAVLQYPEYKQQSWNYPEGDLQIDQRHRARLWVNYGLRWVNGLTLSALETLESGVPYSASNVNGANFNGVDPRPFVTNPGYLTPPAGSNTLYYFTARDAFRTQGQKRTDIAANYTYRLRGTRGVQLFGQVQVLNIFNQEQLCGCGGTVFQNGGAVTQTRIDQSVLTAVTNASRFQTFNPFTTTPIQGVNWDYGPNFGKALNRLAYTSPRQFRLSFGVRF
jgi:outer membrane receptor protein involved in Fe transport